MDTKTTRPALDRLELDIREIIEAGGDVPGLMGGFDSRAEFVEWEQRLVVRTLGEVPQAVYLGFGSHLASPQDRPLVSVLLADSPLDEQTASVWRKRIRKKVVQRGFDQAYKKVRSGATEYLTAENDEEIDVRKQSNVGMRPALTKMDRAQHEVLKQLFDGGLEDRDAILDWGIDLEHAVYGESIWFPGDGDIPVGEFIDQLHDPGLTVELLTQSRYSRVRETFAARLLIPAFNKGVRLLVGYSGETVTDGDNTDKGASVDV